MRNRKSDKVHYCCDCRAELTDSNWHNCNKKRFLCLCRECCSKRSKEDWKKNQKARYRQHRAYYQQNKDKLQIYFKDYNLKLKYGISLEDYNKLLVKQDFKCAICKIPDSRLDLGLYVDHNHITGKVRGLLCQRCNSALGLFDDNKEFLRNALDYI